MLKCRVMNSAHTLFSFYVQETENTESAYYKFRYEFTDFAVFAKSATLRVSRTTHPADRKKEWKHSGSLIFQRRDDGILG